MIKGMGSLAGCRRVFIDLERRTSHKNLLSAEKIGISLFSGLGYRFFALLKRYGSAQTAATHFTYIVHAHGSDGLHARIDFRCADDETSTSANTENADFFPIHEVACAEKVHGGAEGFGVHVRRYAVAWDAAAFSPELLIDGKGHKTARRKLCPIDA